MYKYYKIAALAIAIAFFVVDKPMLETFFRQCSDQKTDSAL